MKHSIKMLTIPVLIIGFNIHTFAQQTLPEVEVKVTATNYKYLKSIKDTTAAEPVNLLQMRAASYDVKKSQFYEDEYDNYFISFYIPEGEILAVYDQNGKLLRTAEKYKNITIPKVVRNAVVERFPNWAIAETVYLVRYSDAEGGKLVYKLVLENGDKRLKVSANEKGEILKQ